MHIPALYNAFSYGNNQQIPTLSYRSAYLLFSVYRNIYIHQNRTVPEVRMVLPSVPSYSSILVLRTSYYMHNHCCIFPDLCTDRSDYKDMDTPMSWNHRSYHGVHSVDVFQSLIRYHHSMPEGLLTNAELQRYHCLLLH